MSTWEHQMPFLSKKLQFNSRHFQPTQQLVCSPYDQIKRWETDSTVSLLPFTTFVSIQFLNTILVTFQIVWINRTVISGNHQIVRRSWETQKSGSSTGTHHEINHRSWRRIGKTPRRKPFGNGRTDFSHWIISCQSDGKCCLSTIDFSSSNVSYSVSILDYKCRSTQTTIRFHPESVQPKWTGGSNSNSSSAKISPGFCQKVGRILLQNTNKFLV